MNVTSQQYREQRRETLGLMFGFIGVVIFAATLPFSRLAVPDLGPWFITFGRAAVAGLIALVVLRLLKRPIPSRGQLLQPYVW